MEWWIALSLGLGLLIGSLLIGLPVFVGFLLVNLAGLMFYFGPRGFTLFSNSIFDTVANTSISTIALFILMGELLFRSGAADVVFSSVDRLIGRLRGRDFVLTAALGTIFGALSGAAMGVVAMLGRSLLPKMLVRGCDRKLSVGAIIGGANLAPIIPPSVLIVVIGMLAGVSISRFLVAGIVPGLIIAALILTYTLIRVHLSPSLAGRQEERRPVGFGERLRAIGQLIPFSVIIFFVMGFILLGIATPSESAASGVVASILVAAYYRKLTWRMLATATASAAAISATILVIMASSTLFSQLLALSGATRALAQLVADLDVSRTLLLLIMMVIPFLLCMFMDQIAISIVFIPIYQPILAAAGFDPLWFWTLFLINVTLGGFTPPFGYVLFALKASYPDLRLEEIYRSVWPFVGIFLLAMLIIALFPTTATYLPSLM
jgi:tripartite ATP-independent transporter DctM subunit